MNISIATIQSEATLVVNAYRFYKSQRYNDAIPVLQNMLDLDSRNWQARLFIAVCLLRTGQVQWAEQTLLDMLDQCQEPHLRNQALLVLHVARQEVPNAI